MTLVLNDRPLTYVSEDNEERPLTPNDLIMRKFRPMELDFAKTLTETTTEAYVKHQLKYTDEILKTFWYKWSHDYLQFLRERQATCNFRKNTNNHAPRVGDVVIIEDDVHKCRQWTLAKIIQLQRSEDNEVRSAVVKVGTGAKIARPIQKLYYLELNEFTDQNEPLPTSNDGTLMDGIDNIVTT